MGFSLISLQITVSVGIVIIYVFLVIRYSPWKFRLNHNADISFKLGFVYYVMFLQVNEAGSVVDVFLIGSIVFPTFIVMCLAIRRIWYARVALVKASRIRADSAQRLADLIAIASTKNLLDLRQVSLGLSENDAERIEEALDSLQVVLTGLQPNSFWKYRCMPKPFEVIVPGRLEGEVVARGVQDPQDARCLCRRLQKMIEARVPMEASASVVKRSKGNITGLPPELIELFDRMEEDGDKRLDGREFVEGFYGLYGSEDATGLSREEIVKLFNFMDVDRDGSIDRLEFVSALYKVESIVLPKGDPRMQISVPPETAGAVADVSSSANGTLPSNSQDAWETRREELECRKFRLLSELEALDAELQTDATSLTSLVMREV